MEYTIYKIRNKLNDKIYIGRTFDYKTRILQHLYGSKSDLQKDMKTYGKENFECSIVENVLEAEQSKKREGYWIDYYKSNNAVYNKTSSGKFVDTGKYIITINIGQSLYDELIEYAGKLQEKSHGVNLSLSDVIRRIIYDTVKGGKK